MPEQSAQCRQSSACSSVPSQHPEDAMPHRCLQCGDAFRLCSVQLQHHKSHAVTAAVAIPGRAANATHAGQLCNHAPELNGGCKQSSACSTAPAEHPEDAMPHSCLQCGDAFQLHSALLQHQKSHAIEGSNASSAANAAHAEHLCNHTPELNGGYKQSSACSVAPAEHPEDAMPHRCLQCGDAFRLHSALLQHQKSHAIEGSNASSAANAAHAEHLCNHTPELNGGYKQSSACSVAPAEHPKDAMPHRCLQCGAAFRLHSALLQHQKSHAIEGSNASSAANAAHAEHLCNHTPELNGGYKQSSACSVAPAEHPEDAMPHRCLQCGDAFRLHSALLQHQKSHAIEGSNASSAANAAHAEQLCNHAPELSAQCRQSSACSAAPAQHPEDAMPHRCLQCGAAFRLHSVLLQHQKSHTIAAGVAIPGRAANATHTEQLCNHAPELNGGCKQSSACSSVPSQHPEDAMPHRCLQCGAAFRLHSALLQHQKSHAGPRPHACTDCGKAFREATTLRRHRRIHTGEKPYGCPYCGKSFRASSTLIIHQRIHTGEKPYPCGSCAKSFVSSSSLMKHRRTHQRQAP
uniref:C2H2-type domain-containing protein n=1 Tax=Gallus gallus TaxID=9031 RepID=A0A8V0X4E8_CHICK